MVLHLVMDFAETVTLPSMIHQPGQLHFITGLRLDLFGILCSNIDEDKIFSLPEGHWPNTKDASSVLSMFYHVIQELKTRAITNSARSIIIHADKCRDQHKNRFAL